MKRTIMLGLCLSLAAGLFATVEPSTTTYATECRTFDVWDRANPATMTALTTTPRLAFPDVTLEQLAGTSALGTPYTMLSYMCGGWVGCKGPAYEQLGKTAVYRNEAGEIQFMVKGFALWDNYADNNRYTKCVVAKLTDGDGGVYAQVLAARYVNRQGSSLGSTFFTVAEDGTIAYQQATGTLATSYSGGGYGLCGLVAAPFVPSAAPATVWTNPADEPVLTLDDIAEHRITARMAGASVGLASDVAAGYNRYEVRDTDGHLTLIRLEMQMLDDKYVKCVVLELTNAADGVAAQVLRSVYKATADGGFVGMNFIKDNATFDSAAAASYTVSQFSALATSFAADGYGLYALTATPQPSVELVLDRSKTWTELVDGVDVSDPTVTLRLRATAADAVLTFDGAIGYDNLVIIPAETQANTFRVAAGVDPANIQFGKMTVEGNLRLALPPSLGATEIAVAAGSTLVYAGGDEAAATVSSCISGGGGVEVASGKVAFANAASTYMGGTRVKDGATAVPAAAAVNASFALWTSVFGTVASGNLVTIDEGGLVDLAGCGAGGYYALAGTNRIVNTGADTGSSVGLWGFSLTDHATLDFIDNPFHFISSKSGVTFALGAYTFTKAGTGTVRLASDGATVTGSGTFDIAGGAFEVARGNFTASAATLRVETNATLRVAGSSVSAKNVVVDGLLEFEGAGSASLAGLMSGTGTVRKVGSEWTATVQINNGSRLAYEVTGGVIAVGSCTLAQPDNCAYAFNTPGEPRRNVAVTVGGTGSFDFHGVESVTPCCTIAGKGYSGTWGALCNHGKDLLLTRQQMVQLTLADDAQVGGLLDVGSFGLLAPNYKESRLELGEYTMTVCKTNRFYLVNTTITGTGKIDVQHGTLYLYRASAGDAYTLEIGEDGRLELDAPLTTGSFVNHGEIAGASALTVKGTVTTTTNAIPNLVLADGATVKVADGRTPLLVSDALTLRGAVAVDVDGIVPGEDGLGEIVRLFDVPSATVTSGVKFTMVNLEPGVAASFARGFPELTRSGLCVIIK